MIKNHDKRRRKRKENQYIFDLNRLVFVFFPSLFSHSIPNKQTTMLLYLVLQNKTKANCTTILLNIFRINKKNLYIISVKSKIFDGIFIIGVKNLRWSCYIIEFRSSWFSQRAKKNTKNIQVIIKNNQIIREKDNKRLRKIWIDNKRETKQLISSFSSRPSRAAAIAALQPPHHHHHHQEKRLIIYLNDDEFWSWVG